jgi:uncharacterized LabA/DUF88 family protein
MIRTAVFVDGYNLYYGRLRGTPYKWLDLVKLSTQLLADRSQSEVLSKVTLCTAHAASTFATHGRDSTQSQASYHRALTALHGDRLEIIYGSHTWEKNGVDMPVFRQGQAFTRSEVVRVWKVEEKMTDVNLALSMYRACAKGLCERLIVMSNDRDVAPALDAIKKDFPGIVCGVVFPLRPWSGAATTRRQSGTLEKIADWHLNSISDAMLAAAQLPSKLALPGKKTIVKPSYW